VPFEALKKRVLIYFSLIAVFALVLFFRLWYLQVMASPEFVKLAEKNRVKVIPLEPLRGKIYDRKGKDLAINQPSLAVAILPQAKKKKGLVEKIADFLQIPPEEIKEKLEKSRGPFKYVVVKEDISLEEASFIAEHKEEFPFTEVVLSPQRSYPSLTLGAHILGYVGEVSEKELELPLFKQCEPGDIVGKAGVERSFDPLLRGEKGEKKVEVDAIGKVRRVLSIDQPTPGYNLYLTLDKDLQSITEETLVEAIKLANKKGAEKARAGAIVVMNPQNGEILALASYPTYDPNALSQGLKEKEWKKITSKKSNYPLLNRVVMSAYPPGSTFKPFTLVAGIESGVIGWWSTFYCRGRWTGMGESWPKYCWRRSGHGTVNLRRAISESCDVAFYEIGYKLYKTKTEVFQKWARKFGFGEKTDIDLPSESAGRVPDKKWKKSYFKRREMQVWLPGDTVNMAIGQGDLIVTPLQLAVAYSALLNGGKVLKPQVVKEVKKYSGEVVFKSKPEVKRKIPLDEGMSSRLKYYLGSVVEEGTARKAFAGFHVKAGGKTGTAEVYGKEDFAWFVGFAPLDDPQYLVVVLIEEGGHGGEIAAPAARRILAYLFGEELVMPDISERSR
jgi:penicillin-binding protein 2